MECIGFQGCWYRIVETVEQPRHPACKTHAAQPLQLDATALAERRQQRQGWCGIQVIKLAVTKIVGQQLVHVHLVAGGDPVEP